MKEVTLERYYLLYHPTRILLFYQYLRNHIIALILRLTCNYMVSHFKIW